MASADKSILYPNGSGNSASYWWAGSGHGDGMVGVGGVNGFRSLAYFVDDWWRGTNIFTTYGTNGWISKSVALNPSMRSVRVVLNWLNTGTVTGGGLFNLQSDLDLYVYDPAGNFVGAAGSRTNAFEVFEFRPTVTGNYTFKFATASSNTNSYDVAMAVTWVY